MVTMPIYDYECQSCRLVFELFVRLPNAEASEPLECPSCKGRELRQIPSAFSVSSAAIRRTHLDQARQVLKKTQDEKNRADIEAIEHHDR
jgi:putative FmdB family regulatory protein